MLLCKYTKELLLSAASRSALRSLSAIFTCLSGPWRSLAGPHVLVLTAVEDKQCSLPHYATLGASSYTEMVFISECNHKYPNDAGNIILISNILSL